MKREQGARNGSESSGAETVRAGLGDPNRKQSMKVKTAKNQR